MSYVATMADFKLHVDTLIRCIERRDDRLKWAASLDYPRSEYEKMLANDKLRAHVEATLAAAIGDLMRHYALEPFELVKAPKKRKPAAKRRRAPSGKKRSRPR